MANSGAIRATERYPIRVSVEVTHPRSARRIEAELRDISTGGCRIVTPEPLPLGSQILLTIKGLDPWPAAVAWSRDGCIGIAFHTLLDYAIAEHYARLFR